MSLNETPDNLPIPEDDGAADHLEGMSLPDIVFTATSNETVLFNLLQGYVVIYVYPMTGQPGTPLPEGWDDIPGARGCTPQACSFRDHYSELKSLDTHVFGLSAQSTRYQQEAKERLQLPFELLSDQSLSLNKSLQLPTFMATGMELYKRITLIVENGVIVKTFYPVFPPNESAEQVLSWLRTHG
ncbi:MAG: peroxiredoxin [Gammaproteobacteria bacterium]|nr:peroxiredoxin [Gammaproteobacteria bacterium]